VPFGDWLNSQGVPFGFAVASSITALEIFGTVLFALGFRVFPLSLLFACIYAVGAVLVHLPAGWFVVGAGRNGMEYSVLLIICLLLVGIQHKSTKGKA
jgi:putative oxidoreductase